MLILRCIGYAIWGGISAAFLISIPGCVILLVASIFGFGENEVLNAVLGCLICLALLVGIIGGFMVPISEKEARRRRIEEEEAARLQRHKEEQQRYYQEMVVLGDQSISLFESLPKYLNSAEEYLDQAEVDFAERAFAPFWDSIEKAAKMLGHFDEGVRSIKDKSSCYIELIRKYESMPPQFPLSVSSVKKLEVGIATAKRMQVVVRCAQCDFQFATIYEQRKTSQILVAGFKNLAQALAEMTWKITTSIDNLAASVDVMTSTLNESLQVIHSQLDDLAEMSSRQHAERTAREMKALEMLDNIQRRRKII